ncbi:unnamed protein product [Nesidiocoris tenuis]|uniref:Cytochrome b561 domain-containing protein n=1 Tax=Nesidiocoris tenuis TaxID=355587 RepID=A0A6H5G411_9HEMI|nr:unnamed protein product [Nesidiocoris tenuis]
MCGPFALLVLLIAQAAGYKSGAPPSMCKDMMPHHHGSPPQSGPAPFAVAAEPSGNEDEGRLRVTLSGSAPFAGVLLQAREGGVEGEAVGSFAALPDNFKTLDCNNFKRLYDGCGVRKNCLGSPVGCEKKRDCIALIAVSRNGQDYEFEMMALNSKYVAVGLSADNKMGGDSVMECVQERNAIKLYSSWNKPGEKANTREKVNQSILKLINSSYTDGVIYCEFTRDASSQIMSTSFDLIKNQYFLLLAAGSSLKEKSVGYHDIFFVASGQKRSLSEVAALTSQSKLFVRLHGSFMVAAWIGTASIGIVLARYFKETWVESSLCAKDLWFAWHRFFMLITWCLTLVASVLIFIDVGGWVSSTPSMIHAIFGCCTVVFCFVQPIGAAFRPHPAARNRPFFNWIHWFIGNAAHICSVLALFFATPVAKAELPAWLDWILFAYVVLYVVVHLLLTISGCISDSKGSDRVNTFPLKDLNTSRSALNSVERKMDASRTKILAVVSLAKHKRFSSKSSLST